MTKWEDDGDRSHKVSLETYGGSKCISREASEAETSLLSPNAVPSQLPRWKIWSLLSSITSWCALRNCSLGRARRIRRVQLEHWLSPLFRLIFTLLVFLTAMIAFFGIFLPSYTIRPPHYTDLRNRVNQGWKSGSANVNQEKVFIAASIYDPQGELAGGAWASNILQLIHILGPDNVYLSIYENDSGSRAMEALELLEQRVSCNHTLIAEDHFNFNEMTRIRLPNGRSYVNRIAYLAEVRNRALRPLDNAKARFDKLLFLNDVVFDPIEAAQLLFSTNVGGDGRAQYRSACAVDFINPFKFYDTFATRDLDGYSMGLPFFPWFSAAGGHATLDDVLSQKDAVRVRSCWGGMVSFDARFFQEWPDKTLELPTAAQSGPANLTAPYRFRAHEELWWEASECCLIQADIQNPDTSNSEIFLNPFVRVAYDTRTLSWLWFTRRFERLYTSIHSILDILANLPQYNPRKDEEVWQQVEEDIWLPVESTSVGGSWQRVLRFAEHDGFCGRRRLQVMKEKMTPGGENYLILDPPPLRAV